MMGPYQSQPDLPRSPRNHPGRFCAPLRGPYAPPRVYVRSTTLLEYHGKDTLLKYVLADGFWVKHLSMQALLAATLKRGAGALPPPPLRVETTFGAKKCMRTFWGLGPCRARPRTFNHVAKSTSCCFVGSAGSLRHGGFTCRGVGRNGVLSDALAAQGQRASSGDRTTLGDLSRDPPEVQRVFGVHGSLDVPRDPAEGSRVSGARADTSPRRGGLCVLLRVLTASTSTGSLEAVH